MTPTTRYIPKNRKFAVLNNLAMVLFLLLIAPKPTKAQCSLSFEASSLTLQYSDSLNFPVSEILPSLTYPPGCDESDISTTAYTVTSTSEGGGIFFLVQLMTTKLILSMITIQRLLISLIYPMTLQSLKIHVVSFQKLEHLPQTTLGAKQYYKSTSTTTQTTYKSRFQYVR